jgi:small subunit ribosomal protein S16
MAVHIRLQRKGATHKPFYHLVATDHRSARDGRHIERLGFYDPAANPSLMNFKQERVQYWFGKGAQLSNTAKKLMEVQNITLTREKTAQPAKA